MVHAACSVVIVSSVSGRSKMLAAKPNASIVGLPALSAHLPLQTNGLVSSPLLTLALVEGDIFANYYVWSFSYIFMIQV